MNTQSEIQRSPSFYVKNPAKIIQAACKTVGITASELEQAILSTPTHSGQFCCRLQINMAISIQEWSLICKVLHLDMNCIFYGYCPELHQSALGRRAKRQGQRP